MNLANSYYQEPEFEYQSDSQRKDTKDEKVPRKSRAQYARTARPAAMHNGIHRRRNKRFAW